MPNIILHSHAVLTKHGNELRNPVRGSLYMFDHKELPHMGKERARARMNAYIIRVAKVPFFPLRIIQL